MTQISYQRSKIIEKRKETVRQEYIKSSRLPTDSQKAKWGSEEGMLNRFSLGYDLVVWSEVRSWLDVGCGTGRFFTLVEEHGERFQQLIGVDFTRELIIQARQRILSSPVNFEISDLETMPYDLQDVDLITLVGVLQLCGCPLETAITHCVNRLTPGGQIFLTTKHIGWSAFERKGFEPNPNHSWFAMDDIRQVVEGCGVEILTGGGFLPREGVIVSLKDTHTLFVYGRKTK